LLFLLKLLSRDKTGRSLRGFNQPRVGTVSFQVGRLTKGGSLSS